MLIDDKNQEYFTLKEIQIMQNKSIKKNTIYIKLLRLEKQGKITPYKPSQNIKAFKKYGKKSINLYPKEQILKYFITPNFLKSYNAIKYFPKYNLLELVKNAITFEEFAIKIYKNPIILPGKSYYFKILKKINPNYVLDLDQYGLFKTLNKDYIDNILIIFNAKPREKRIPIKGDKLSRKNKKEETKKFFGWKLFKK
ncbi:MULTISPECIES: hypothetical protein [Borreliella]|uniref:Uncharacterized protein n=2 Tax=Borreliella TaxID=64895 RepID=C0RC09_9SPIR|nr:hypothetical protein [Borreliella spielmanii]ACJ73233.1 hypothetical protein BafACA1_D03 [Borreliella afzelii ACA-1]AJY72913.1 hypothetical protein BAFK78_D001 [Borreliella afzelii K78]APJ09314.1 hypothetical protein BLA32_05435 [Borreliella afzelii]ACN53282.1 conserved hypothetical protein [Borreliella spielmanii A14S]MBB5141522.1 hypothetical protein [Borreliella afzelii]